MRNKNIRIIRQKDNYGKKLMNMNLYDDIVNFIKNISSNELKYINDTIRINEFTLNEQILSFCKKVYNVYKLINDTKKKGELKNNFLSVKNGVVKFSSYNEIITENNGNCVINIDKLKKLLIADTDKLFENLTEQALNKQYKPNGNIIGNNSEQIIKTLENLHEKLCIY